MDTSELEVLKLSDLVSKSAALTVPILVWFSSALKVADDVKYGASPALRSWTLTLLRVIPSFAPINMLAKELSLLPRTTGSPIILEPVPLLFAWTISRASDNWYQ